MTFLNVVVVDICWDMKRLNKQFYKKNTMVCPPVGEDNPLAITSVLSYIQVNNHGTCITIS